MMNRKEALQKIISLLEELDHSRSRLSQAREESLDIEIALLNQHILSLYNQLQQFSKLEKVPEYRNSRPDLLERPSVKPAEKPAAMPQPEPAKPVQQPKPEPLRAEAPKPQPVPVYQQPQPAPIEKAVEQPKPAPAPTPQPQVKQPVEAATPAPKEEKPEPIAEKAAAPVAEPSAREVSQQPVEENPKKDISSLYAQAREKASGNGSNAPKEPKQEVSLNDRLHTPQTSLNDRLANQHVKKNLADKLKLSPISDLKTAIGINQRVAFINQLFNGDDKEFKKVINFINTSRSFPEAKYYVQSEVAPAFQWSDDNPLVQEFMELVYRKFI